MHLDSWVDSVGMDIGPYKITDIPYNEYSRKG